MISKLRQNFGNVVSLIFFSGDLFVLYFLSFPSSSCPLFSHDVLCCTLLVYPFVNMTSVFGNYVLLFVFLCYLCGAYPKDIVNITLPQYAL